MTKSEAKAIEQRAAKAVQVLSGVAGADGAIDWSIVMQGGREAVDNVNNAIKIARENAGELLEMACAELGSKR